MNRETPNGWNPDGWRRPTAPGGWRAHRETIVDSRPVDASRARPVRRPGLTRDDWRYMLLALPAAALLLVLLVLLLVLTFTVVP